MESRTLPNFLYIGCDRCGSKSLHRIFQQHPDCFIPSIADPYFFDKNYDRGLNWYAQLFQDANPGAKAIGEFSHDYIHSEDAARRIAHDLPDAKILATLRHPIERTFSSYVAAYNAGVIKSDFGQALQEVPMLRQNSLYANKLDIYFNYFDRSKIKVLFFDDLQADPASFTRQAFDFLNLDFIENIDYGFKMNPLSSPRLPFSGYISKKGADLLRKLGWVTLLGKLKGSPLIRGIFYKKYSAGDRPVMDPAIRKELCEYFAGQIDRLETMLDRDLSKWRV